MLKGLKGVSLAQANMFLRLSSLIYDLLRAPLCHASLRMCSCRSTASHKSVMLGWIGLGFRVRRNY